MTDQDEMIRRIRYICDHVAVPGGVVVAHHPAEWPARAADPLELALGWAPLAIDHEAHTVELHLSPATLARATVMLPWSPDQATIELVLDEDAIDDPEEQTYTIPIDDETHSDGRCRRCDRVHAAVAPQVHYEACDDPDPDAYWFFDNLVRVINIMAEAELVAFADDEFSGIDSTVDRRRHMAWEHLYRLHPALHRFLLTAMAMGLDQAAQEAA